MSQNQHRKLQPLARTNTLGVPVTYVVANPSSYAWPAALRPLPQDDADPAAAKDGWSLTPDTAAHTKFTYGPYDAAAKNCANYNRWPAGLENRTGYTAKTMFAAKAKNITVVVENSGHRPLGK